ncbi:hypothetical protein M758_3G126000 [Ceratodon purpureus]|nr:hypothetical protein M758_3G126000 [Ceratodon purpureus]
MLRWKAVQTASGESSQTHNLLISFSILLELLLTSQRRYCHRRDLVAPLVFSLRRKHDFREMEFGRWPSCLGRGRLCGCCCSYCGHRV